MLEKLPDVIGHALQGQRAGLEKILFNRIDLRTGTARIEVSSMAFADHAPIPPRFTADGEGGSPQLQWRNVPESATTLVLIVEDADSPTPEPLVHAIAVVTLGLNLYDDTLQAILWSVGILVVGFPLGLWLYNRRTTQ